MGDKPYFESMKHLRKISDREQSALKEASQRAKMTKCTCGSTKRTAESHSEDCACRRVILTTGVTDSIGLTDFRTYEAAKKILWDCAGMSLHSDRCINMEPETFIACIRDAMRADQPADERMGEALKDMPDVFGDAKQRPQPQLVNWYTRHFLTLRAALRTTPQAEKKD